MKYTIHEITSVNELKKYADFPNRLYKDSPYYVPGLFSDDFNTFNWEKNPAYEYCDARFWFALDEKGDIVGRICAIVNHKYIELWKHKYGRFGFIDFIEDYDVCKLLLDTACHWLVDEKGMDGVVGPLGFCDLDPEGMLIDGFDEIGTLTTIYNYPYYPEYIERYGFVKDVDWYEYKMTVDALPQIMFEISENVKRKYKLRVFEAKTIKQVADKYGREIFALVNQTYASLYNVVPLTEKQITAFINQYLGLIPKDFIRLIVNENDELISFGLGMPSLTEPLQKYRGKLLPFGFISFLKHLKTKHPKVIDLLLIATRDDYQRKGVNAMLFCELYNYAKERNVELFNINPQLETNIKVRSGFKHFNITQNKTRRSYIKIFHEEQNTSDETKETDEA